MVRDAGRAGLLGSTSGAVPRAAFTGGSRIGSAGAAELRISSRVDAVAAYSVPFTLVGSTAALPLLRAAIRAPGFFKYSSHDASRTSALSTP